MCTISDQLSKQKCLFLNVFCFLNSSSATIGQDKQRATPQSHTTGWACAIGQEAKTKCNVLKKPQWQCLLRAYSVFLYRKPGAVWIPLRVAINLTYFLSVFLTLSISLFFTHRLGPEPQVANKLPMEVEFKSTEHMINRLALSLLIFRHPKPPCHVSYI